MPLVALCQHFPVKFNLFNIKDKNKKNSVYAQAEFRKKIFINYSNTFFSTFHPQVRKFTGVFSSW